MLEAPNETDTQASICHLAAAARSRDRRRHPPAYTLLHLEPARRVHRTTAALETSLRSRHPQASVLQGEPLTLNDQTAGRTPLRRARLPPTASRLQIPLRAAKRKTLRSTRNKCPRVVRREFC